MGRRAVDKNAILDLMEKAKEENYQNEEARKQALRDSVKVNCVPADYTYVSEQRSCKPAPSNFVMRWVDSRKSNGAIVTSSGRTFLP